VRSLGMDWRKHREAGRLRVEEVVPVGVSVEEILNRVRDIVAEQGPGRVVFDSIDDLWGVARSDDRVRDALLVMDAIARSEGATTLVLHEMRPRDGIQDVRSDYADVSSCVMQVTMVETDGALRRFFGIRKFTGTDHAKELREFDIDGRGFHVGNKPSGLSGILSGNTSGVMDDIAERVVPELDELGSLIRDLEGKGRKPATVRALRAKHSLLDVLLREHFGMTEFHRLAEELGERPPAGS
jgi:circadian clock protein KaiC